MQFVHEKKWPMAQAERLQRHTLLVPAFNETAALNLLASATMVLYLGIVQEHRARTVGIEPCI